MHLLSRVGESVSYTHIRNSLHVTSQFQKICLVSSLATDNKDSVIKIRIKNITERMSVSTLVSFLDGKVLITFISILYLVSLSFSKLSPKSFDSSKPHSKIW